MKSEEGVYVLIRFVKSIHLKKYAVANNTIRKEFKQFIETTEDGYFLHYYIQRGFTVEHLLNLNSIAKYTMIESMYKNIDDENERWGSK